MLFTFDYSGCTLYQIRIQIFAQFLARFKELIGLEALIEEHFHLEQKANCVYPAGPLIDHLLDCALLGHTRFSHMNALQLYHIPWQDYPVTVGIFTYSSTW